jgi:DNA repair exonuclease SbcCD ATPase subunit
MKIRAITLHNVRRFQRQTARLSGIADGITTITEPNESGKSTFFDALHALFFLSHTSSTAEVRSLQPYSKGAVEITAEIETEQGVFQIAKSFLASKSAVITNLGNNQIVAQAGEAEAWIARAIGTDMAGPAGLLWVRQGISGFGPDGSGASEKRERERLREERQTLMSSVAGQIDSVTGGRRMDAIMRMVEADLDALATKALGPKTSGEWGRAVKLVQELSVAQDALQEQVTALEQALRERSTIRMRLEDPKAKEAEESRAKALDKVKTDLDGARQHARLVEDAGRSLKLAELTLKSIDDRIAAKAALAQRRDKLRQDIERARQTLGLAGDAGREAEASFTSAQAAHQAALAALTAARAAEQAVQKRKDRDAAAKRHKEVTDLLARVAEFETKLTQAREALRGLTVTRKALDALEALDRRRSTAIERRDAGATTLRMIYEGTARVSGHMGALPPDEAVAIYAPTEVSLPGIGRMQITPPRSVGEASETPETLEEQLSQGLAALDLGSLAAARIALAAREGAARDEEAARGALAALVPDGTDELRRELAALNLVPDEASQEPMQVTLTVPEAETLEVRAREALEVARRAQSRAAEKHLEVRTTLRLTQEALGGLHDDTEEAEDLTAPKAGAGAQVETAKAAFEALSAAAPDLGTLEAEEQRLISARDNAKAERERSRDRLNELNGRINERAEDGVETHLEEVRGALEKAQDRADRYASEVKALAELRQQLEQARSAARDAYFGPVIQELRPLIAMLHEGAELEMDPETMLPHKIRRNGVEDDFDMLSGGAAEQIAILTRLAFARLYAKQGRQVPVILDDALVYSDDDRIVQMFTALTKIAKDQQIIVFSCRNRAFEDLGGHRPRIEILPL